METPIRPRIRISFKVSAKGIFQPDVTAEAEDVKTAELNMIDAIKFLKEIAEKEGFIWPTKKE